MSKPAVHRVDAALRGYDSRFSHPPLSVSILEYEGDRSEPAYVVALGVALRAHEGLGVRAGQHVRVGMSVHPDDTNMIVADLEKGGSCADVPACAPTSVVEFDGCTKRGDEDVIEASRFRVIDAVPYPRMTEAEPQTIKSLPKVGT